MISPVVLSAESSLFFDEAPPLPPRHSTTTETETDVSHASAGTRLRQEDADRLWQHYRTYRDPLPAGVQDLAPLVWDLFRVKDWPAGEAQFQHLRDIAMAISRSPRLYLPGHDGFRQVARAVANPMAHLLDGQGRFFVCRPGVVAALKEFSRAWTEWLNALPVDSKPVTLAKAVPIHGPFAASAASVVGVTLGACHPPAGTCLASSTASPDTAAPPRLTLWSEAGGLRLEGAPQTQAELQAADAEDSPSPLELHLFLLQDALDATVRAGGPLQEALDRFHRDAAPEFQLQVAAPLSEAAATAPLEPTHHSGARAMAWFDYRLLAEPGALDRLVTSPAASKRLDLCRRLGHDITAREAEMTRTHYRVPAHQLREWLVAGCAVQVGLEAVQLRQRHGQRFEFKVPVHEVFHRMTPLEQSVMTGVVGGLHALLPGVRTAQDVLSPPEPPPAGITYLSMDGGDPMGCVVLKEDRQADDATAEDCTLHPDLEALLASIDAEPLRNRSHDARFEPGAHDVDIHIHPEVQDQDDPVIAPFAALQLQRHAREESLAQLRRDQSIDVAIHLHGDARNSTAHRFAELRPAASPAWLGLLTRGDDLEAAMGATGDTLDPALLLDPETLASFAHVFDDAVDQLLHDLRTPRQWTDFSADLSPRVLVDVPAWPVGRTLDIHDAQSGTLMLRFGEPMADRLPVRVARWPQGDRYAAVQGGHLLTTPADGDGFLSAVLTSMVPEERLELLRAAGCTEAGAQWLGPSVTQLRKHLAQHLDQHRERYRSSIVLHQFLAG